MTTEQFEIISSLNSRIKTIKRLLAGPITARLVKSRDSSLYQADGFFLNELKLGDKIAKVLENAECEVGTILAEELERLEKEFSAIIVGTELRNTSRE